MSQPTILQKAVALLSLTAVSTAIGITMKISQTGGKYEFHPASCLVLTELFKLVSSLVLVTHVLRAQQAEEHTTFTAALKSFWNTNFTGAVIRHELGLAVAYCVVNLVTYPIFMHASASVFFLLKAASPVVTAVMLRVLVNRNVSVVQWFAILAQCVGLLVTQYNPCGGGTVVSALGYGLIIVNVVVSCLAGVWNEHIIKNHGTSVNAQNVILYTWGALINFFIFLLMPHQLFGLAKPVGFFEGYTWQALGVIISSGSVGLVITAVYKYADVIVKTFGLAGSTVFLYVLEAMGLLPAGRVNLPFPVLFVGGSLVFYAAYIYIAPARPQPPALAAALEEQQQQPTEKESQLLSDSANERGMCPFAFVCLASHWEENTKVVLEDVRVKLLFVLTLFTIFVSFLFASCQK